MAIQRRTQSFLLHRRLNEAPVLICQSPAPSRSIGPREIKVTCHPFALCSTKAIDIHSLLYTNLLPKSNIPSFSIVNSRAKFKSLRSSWFWPIPDAWDEMLIEAPEWEPIERELVVVLLAINIFWRKADVRNSFEFWKFFDWWIRTKKWENDFKRCFRSESELYQMNVTLQKKWRNLPTYIHSMTNMGIKDSRRMILKSY